jgi:pimeloyl-ACP methyl ester carboxylesterase
MTTVFLHGLESSSQGTKASWFRQNFPEMIIPDFTGTLEERMARLSSLMIHDTDLVLIGSSFGGLMATIYTQQHEDRIKKVVLLAPALNFHEFENRARRKINVPAYLFIGQEDTVCPPDIVIPAAKKIFTDLSICLSNDNHMLRNTFFQIDWIAMLGDIY